MFWRTGDEQIHQNGGQSRQYGQNTLQIEETQNKAKRPHADHVRHPEIANQFTGIVQTHAQALGVFRYPGDKTKLTEDVAQCRNRQEQYANAPFFFNDRCVWLLCMFAQRWEFAAEGQKENRDIHQADTSIDPVPFNATCEQEGRDHGENHARHAEEGVGKQQAGATLATFIHLSHQESTNRHGDTTHQSQHKHCRGEQRQAMAEHQSGDC